MVCLLQVENCTSNYTQQYFVESIRKNFVDLSICEVGWFEVGYGIDITE